MSLGRDVSHADASDRLCLGLIKKREPLLPLQTEEVPFVLLFVREVVDFLFFVTLKAALYGQGR